MVYEPREDSYLLLEAVKKYAYGKVLDVGTGSGVQASEAAKLKRVKTVSAVDVDKESLGVAKKNAEKEKLREKVSFTYSDLFSNVKGKFDTILFNPPYLPDDKSFRDKAVHGGKKGYELVQRFFSEANDYLTDNGVILLVFSSLTKKMKVDEAIQEYCFEKELIAEKNIFFENLFVYLVRKSELLKTLNKKKLKNIKKLASGHRGIIYTGILGKKKIAVKAERKDSASKNIATREARWLKVLNKKGIGPKLISSNKDYFMYEFVEGQMIMDFLEKNSKKNIATMLKNLFMQCFVMDNMKISKEEMHHPLKHVIIGKKVVLIDFERMHKTKKPKNVTQLCQFMISYATRSKKLRINKNAFISAAREYRQNINNKNFNNIIKLIK